MTGENSHNNRKKWFTFSIKIVKIKETNINTPPRKKKKEKKKNPETKMGQTRYAIAQLFRRYNSIFKICALCIEPETNYRCPIFLVYADRLMSLQ